jgi:hypothetical protein
MALCARGMTIGVPHLFPVPTGPSSAWRRARAYVCMGPISVYLLLLILSAECSLQQAFQENTQGQLTGKFGHFSGQLSLGYIYGGGGCRLSSFLMPAAVRGFPWVLRTPNGFRMASKA